MKCRFPKRSRGCNERAGTVVGERRVAVGRAVRAVVAVQRGDADRVGRGLELLFSGIFGIPHGAAAESADPFVAVVAGRVEHDAAVVLQGFEDSVAGVTCRGKSSTEPVAVVDDIRVDFVCQAVLQGFQDRVRAKRAVCRGGFEAHHIDVVRRSKDFLRGVVAGRAAGNERSVVHGTYCWVRRGRGWTVLRAVVVTVHDVAFVAVVVGGNGVVYDSKHHAIPGVAQLPSGVNVHGPQPGSQTNGVRNFVMVSGKKRTARQRKRQRA